MAALRFLEVIALLSQYLVSGQNVGKGNSSPQILFPLFGSVHSTAYWFADVHLGKDIPQRQSLIVDTGSSVMGFPCDDCKAHCGKHIDFPFNVSLSSSCEPIPCLSGCLLCSSTRGGLRRSNPEIMGQCAYDIRYTEGSTLQGKWYSDYVSFGGKTDVKVPFGCHIQETHLFVNQEASGILGLEADSRYGPQPFVTSVLNQILPTKKNTDTTAPTKNLGFEYVSDSSSIQPVFSLCLSQEGGSMSIGSPHTNYHVQSVISKSQKHSINNDADTIIYSNEAYYNPPPVQQNSPLVQNYYPPQYDYSNPQTIVYTPINTNTPDFTLNDNRYQSIYSGSNYAKDMANIIKESIKQSTLNRVTGSSQRMLQGEQIRRKSQIEYFPTITKMQWGNLLTSIDNGRYDSYLVFVNGLQVRGATYIENNVTSNVTLPSVRFPSFNDEAASLRGSPTRGMIALVDSGTTLTYLPFLLYARLWVLIQNELEFSAKIYKDKRTLFHDKYGYAAADGNSLNDTDVVETFSSGSAKIRKTLESLLITNGKRRLLEDDNTISALLEEVKRIQSNSQLSGRALYFKSANKRDLSSASPLRRLVPVSVGNAEEECWYLNNGDDDLKYFPDLKLNIYPFNQYVWRPNSYLYKKGKGRVYCLTIVSKEQDEDEEEDFVRRRLQDGDDLLSLPTSELKRRLQNDQQSAVLGATFFINHDILIHLGKWKIGTIEANCPTTNLSNRRKENSTSW